MIIRARDNVAMTDLNFSVTLNAPDGELAVIRARGADAGTFLQGQLTQDVLLMKTTEARLAAWCSAKGRMLASFIVVKVSAEEFLLILSRDLLANTLKRLKMFVLRAKCELTDISAEVSIEGVLGSVAHDAATAMNLEALRAYSIRARGQNDAEMLLVLPAGHMADYTAGNTTLKAVPRALRIRLDAVPEHANSPQHAAWNALEITSGIARLSAAVSEAFVPQMLNYESVGGVNFKKGCYPGQEVVARSQFRGTLKRRGYIVRSADALQTGQEVFDSREPDQPCGQIAQAAAHPEGGFVAIISMQISAQSSPALHADSPAGALLQLQALPYELLADV
jgi:folate-binding protein YgfZ